MDCLTENALLIRVNCCCLLLSLPLALLLSSILIVPSSSFPLAMLLLLLLFDIFRAVPSSSTSSGICCVVVVNRFLTKCHELFRLRPPSSSSALQSLNYVFHPLSPADLHLPICPFPPDHSPFCSCPSTISFDAVVVVSVLVLLPLQFNFFHFSVKLFSCPGFGQIVAKVIVEQIQSGGE